MQISTVTEAIVRPTTPAPDHYTVTGGYRVIRTAADALELAIGDIHHAGNSQYTTIDRIVANKRNIELIDDARTQAESALNMLHRLDEHRPTNPASWQVGHFDLGSNFGDITAGLRKLDTLTRRIATFTPEENGTIASRAASALGDAYDALHEILDNKD